MRFLPILILMSLIASCSESGGNNFSFPNSQPSKVPNSFDDKVPTTPPTKLEPVPALENIPVPPAWKYDGRIAYVSHDMGPESKVLMYNNVSVRVGNKKLHVLSRNRLRTLASALFIASPNWNDRGNFLGYYISSGISLESIENPQLKSFFQLYVHNFENSRDTPIEASKFLMARPPFDWFTGHFNESWSWTPRSSRLVYSKMGATSGGERTSTLIESNADGTGVFEVSRQMTESQLVVGNSFFPNGFQGVQFSPDESKLSFMFHKPGDLPGKYHLGLLSTTGGPLLASSDLIQWEPIHGAPIWMSGGNELLFKRNSQLYLTPADLSSETELGPLPEYAVSFLRGLSPDGSKFLFINSAGRLFVAKVDGSNVRQLPIPVTLFWPQAEAVWSPDGKHIAFSARPQGQNYADLWVINEDGTGLVNITNTPDVEEYFPAWGKEYTP